MNHAWDRFLFGQVQVHIRRGELTGVGDVLSELHQRGIVLTKVKMDAEGCAFTLGLRDFPILYTACRSRHVKIRFGRRDGLPFMVQRAWKRKSFFAGIAMFVVVLNTLGSIVWKVTVSGVEGDTASQLLMAARDAGLRTGAWRPSLPDVNVLQTTVKRSMPNLLWVGIQIDGGVARIDAFEKVAGVQLEAAKPRNIVAAKTGVIRNVFASRGQILVQKGQLVQPGRVIISGDLAGGAVQVAAEGKVLAEVWYTSKVTVPLRASRTELSGESVQRDYLSIGNTTLRVWGFSQPNYAHEVDEIDKTNWHIGKWVLPVQWQTVHVYEATSQTYQLSVSQAENSALHLVLQDVLSRSGEGSAVLSQRVLQQQLTRGNLYETVLTRMEEDIGKPADIPTKPPIDASRSQNPS